MSSVYESKTGRDGKVRGVLEAESLRDWVIRFAKGLRAFESRNTEVRKRRHRSQTVLFGTTTERVRERYDAHSKCLYGTEVSKISLKTHYRK